MGIVANMPNHTKIALTDEAKRLMKAGICDVTPTRGSDLSAIDLRYCGERTKYLALGDSFKFPTGLKVFLGTDMYYDTETETDNGEEHRLKIGLAGFLMPRSSTQLHLINSVGLLDGDYQGEILLHYKNIGEEQVAIQPGQKIGQLSIVLSVFNAWRIVESFDTVTARGEGGFGHTGQF